MPITDILYDIIAPIVIALIASTGFWAYLRRYTDRPKLQTELLIGLAHDRITYLGMKYIARGWIYHEEHENIVTYLYKPYLELGGNGSVRRIMEEVNRLPIRQHSIEKLVKEGVRNERRTTETTIPDEQ